MTDTNQARAINAGMDLLNPLHACGSLGSLGNWVFELMPVTILPLLQGTEQPLYRKETSYKLFPPQAGKPAAFVVNMKLFGEMAADLDLISRTYPGLSIEVESITASMSGKNAKVHNVDVTLDMYSFVLIRAYAIGEATWKWKLEEKYNAEWRTAEADAWVQGLIQTFKPGLLLADFKTLLDMGLCSDHESLMAWLSAGLSEPTALPSGEYNTR